MAYSPRPINPKGGRNRELVGGSLGYTFFSGHTRAYHAHVHVRGKRRGGRVYVGKEGGWLEDEVEVRHSREWGSEEDEENEREGENGRLICRALSYLRYALYSFFFQPSRAISTLPPTEGSQLPFAAARRAEKGRG